VSKKTKKLIKSRKPEKKLKKPNREKKPNKILKKPTGSVRFGFGFISLKPKKSNRTKPKQKKTESYRKNQVKPV
jgi:hypothetical protein